MKAPSLQFEPQTPDDSPSGGVKRQSGRDQTIKMRDVAKSSGFSPATVSIMPNNAPLEAIGKLAVNIVMEGVNGGLEKRNWNISRHKTNPEVVIRDSTRAAVLSGSDD